MAQSPSQGPSADPETLGFDLSAGERWVYPENYPRREYQFSIVQTALYNNTLVCLPTGLGKTFIAAVVMYNFWRWYPRGRIVFLAPTKPLVAQQVHACHEIMGIPSDQTIELTGAINQTKRRQAWTQKRVVFATPQTFQKDLQNDCVPYDLIKCIVIDEAHKALGKHSYCEIVKMLNEKSKFFRILALSATPGSKIDHVREVIQNLLISELELRDDTSPDITPYTNDRSMEKIIVNLGRDLYDYKERYISIMDPHVRILIKNHILQGSTANISKGRIFMLMKQYDSRPQKASNHGTIMKTLNILLTMYHAYELLVKHGLRAFYNFYMNHSDKFWFESELELQLLLKNIKNYIGDFPVIQPLPDGTIPDVPDNVVFGHNKFDKLRELLEEHFRSFARQNRSTRAIVFVEFRDIVNEVYVLLLQKRPLIRPQMFVGQAGQNQKQQKTALEDFRNNQVNVLISTSVGEEGLDVGEVDLIVCFDISTSTPTRLVQRMGRTGRKRNGRVVLLLTEGKEVQTLNEAMSKKDSLNSKILQSSNIASSLYQSSPRMVPAGLAPRCFSMFIKPLPKTPKPAKPATKSTDKAADKQPRKRARKEQLAEPDEPRPSSSKPAPPASPKKTVSGQSSMMRFLTSQRQPGTQQQQQHNPAAATASCTNDSDSGIQSQECRDPYASLRPGDVQLLTSDSHALEFLTLCAMERSEPARPDWLVLERAWIPERPTSPAEDALEETIAGLALPSPTCLDCIAGLTLCDLPNEDEDVDPESEPEPEPELELGWDEPPDPMEPGAPAAGELGDQELAGEFFGADFGYTDDCRAVEVEGGCIELLGSKYTRTDADCCLAKDEAKDEELDASARVEVDFEDLLDEGTEASSPEEAAGAAEGIFDSMFEELLEAVSSDDEDLFGDRSQDEGAKPLTDETRRTRWEDTAPRPGKREASRSPCHESPDGKRQRLLCQPGDSSDGEAVLGTPPKTRPGRGLLAGLPVVFQAQPSKTSPEPVYPDSDQDLFDDLDFETQFSPDEKDVTLVEEKPKISTENPDDCNVQLVDESNLVEKPDATARSGTQKRIGQDELGEGRAGASRDEPAVSQSEAESEALIGDFDFDEWDDFDLVVKKPSASEEKFSSFFATSCKTSTSSAPEAEKPRTAAAASSGWILSSWQQQSKKVLSLKNLNRNVAGKSGAKAEEKKPPARNETHKTYRLEEAVRPSLRQLALKKSEMQSEWRDKDGFALPKQPKPMGKTAEKENKRPSRLAVGRPIRRKDNNVSPRFRRYHSESSLYSPDNNASRNRRGGGGEKGKKRKRRLANEFIEDEAQVSSDCDTSAGSSGEDEDLGDFVSYTQVHDDEDMRAHYLQTINHVSPVRAGAFVIREPRSRPRDLNVYSQPVSQIEDSYLHDSFCVGDETQIAANDIDSPPNDSVLEDLESCLKSRRERLEDKRKLKFKNLEKKRKRNKIERDSSSNSEATNNSSSEDETEVLRRQILEESMLLKKSK